MDTKKMREQFKQALHAQKEFKLSVEAIAAAEWAWQASREAVVVELPDYLDTDRLGFPAYDAEQVDRAIEAQGLKVAP